MPYSSLLRTAIEAARAGEEVIKHYYRRDPVVSLKPDHTPVTVADVEAEKAIKQVLGNAFPEHGFYGEETGRERSGAEYIWLVDPIDGTKSFVRGTPFFSTQIALIKGEEFLLGVSNAPLFGELACAEVDRGAFLNDRPLRVSEVGTLADATLSLGNIRSLAADRRWGFLARLVRRVNRTRGYGDFCHYHLLAGGRLDVVLESDVNILDVAALGVIVHEAGGRMTDLAGGPLNLSSTTVLASNGCLHDQVLAILDEAHA